MADLIGDYLDRLTVRNYSPATIKSYGEDLAHAQGAVGKDLVKATEEDLERYMAQLSRAGLKPSTIKRKQSALRGFYDHCRRRKKLKVRPSDNLEAPKLEERLPVHLTPGQVEKLIDALAGDTLEQRRDAAIVMCLYQTGMRAGELVGLTFNDLFLDERELRVFGKGRRERMLPVTEQLAAALKRWVAVHPTGEGPLFVGIRYPHNPLKYQGAWLVVKKALARAGLAGRKFSPHKLRHTFATRLLSRKVELDKIQKLLGHRRIDTTTIYAHTKIESGLADRMGEAL